MDVDEKEARGIGDGCGCEGSQRNWRRVWL